MLAIIDYGVGNLFSLQCSLNKIGVENVVTSDVEVIKNADRIILPGVGAFGDAVKKLRESGMFEVVIDEAKKGKPLMGICLGMQMLFEKSYEYGEYEGLGLIKGETVSLKGRIPEELDIPHMGWNALKLHNGKNELFKYINEGDCVYFVHSYFGVECDEALIASAEYGIDVTAAVAKNNVYGCQFHPEKSGDVGLKILKAFCEI
ncbi:MAG: imidazole glycerol phosphate synthase subunit HisH [Clostridia bacterium]|nr:imidazole glycerol phosphate synthase subunit HisH [Clostridia bacterium]MBO5434086.1 imidazole glycerol phosphate synthase subunit HisH [Clostridia bacterium]